MPSHWEETTWGEAVELKYGKAIRGYQDAEEAYPVFGTNGQVGTHAQYLAEGPGVILGRKGAYRGVHYSKQPFFVIDTAYYVAPKQDFEMRWLYYAMQHYKLGQIDDGSPIPSTTRAAVYSSEFKRPPIEEQSDIAACLGSLDDKIELNRRMNESLEEMARALFRDWFVDFGPTCRQAEGATDPAAIMGHAFPPEKAAALAPLFPAKLGDDGLPEGWSTTRTEEVSTKIAMGPFGSNIKVSTFVETGVPIISGHHLHGTLMKHRDHKFITEEHADRLKNSNVFEGDIIFTHAGTIGQVSMIGTGGEFDRYVISQRQFYLRPDKSKISPLYLLMFFKSSEGQHELLANASQVGVPSIARPSSHLKGIEICLPPKDAMDVFESIVGKLFEKLIANQQENQTLAEMRDLLLPKLMSGEIRLKDAEAAA